MSDNGSGFSREWATVDLCDEHEAQAQSCDVAWRRFGGRTAFAGRAATVRCFEDNVLMKQALTEPGEGRVLVVDAGGSTRVALMGDLVAQLAVDNGWTGVVILGAVRDIAALATLPLGVVALGCVPRRSLKNGLGERDIEVTIGGALVRPGDAVYVDEDGVLVLPADP